MSGDGVDAYIGMGSNLAGPAAQLTHAFDELAELPTTSLSGRSPLYHSAPLGPADQPDYVNAVARLRTQLDPFDLLDALQAIESAHQRIRARHWGPRTLDLDLLLYGERRIDTPRLVVPHPQLHRRAFVLVPLHAIAPDLVLPEFGPLDALLDTVDTETVTQLG